METIVAKNSIKVINDSYNASYESIKAALEYISSIASNRKIAVLGDVLELGEFSEEMHKKIGREVVNNNIDILITVGKQSKYTAQMVKKLNSKITTYICDTNKEAIDVINKIKHDGDIILVKASNGMKFDEIIEEII